MIDFLKDNAGKAIELVQERYGNLDETEIETVKKDPGRLLLIVEEKFGVSREEVESFLRTNLTKSGLGAAASGLADNFNGVKGF